MKVGATRLAPLLAALEGVRVVALHGANPGIVRQIGRTIVDSALAGDADPFRLSLLEGCDAAMLEAALASRSLSLGRPVVWVPEASEKLASMVEPSLRGAWEGLLVLGFGERFERSAPASALARGERGCLVDCRVDGSGAAGMLMAMMRPLDARCDEAPARALAAWADEGGRSLESAAAMAALLVGPGGRVDPAALEALGVAADAGALGGALRAGLAGDAVALDAAVGRALADGQAGVGLIRQALAQLQFARASGSGSAGAAQAGAVAHAIGKLWAAERCAKRTAAPQDGIAAQAVRGLARGRDR